MNRYSLSVKSRFLLIGLYVFCGDVGNFMEYAFIAVDVCKS